MILKRQKHPEARARKNSSSSEGKIDKLNCERWEEGEKRKSFDARSDKLEVDHKNVQTFELSRPVFRG